MTIELNLRALRIAAKFAYEQAADPRWGAAGSWEDRAPEFQQQRMDALAFVILKYLEASEALP